MLFFRVVLVLALLISPISAISRTLSLDEGTSLDYTGDVTSWMLNRGIRERSGLGADPAALDAVAQLFRERHPRASVALQNYFERFPRDPAAFNIAGVELLRQQKFDRAILSFARAVELGNRDPWTRAQLGMSYMLAGKSEAGDRILNQVIEEDVSNPIARRYLAWSEMQHGNLPRAIQHSEAVLNAFGLPGDTVNRAHLDLAELYRSAQRHLDVKVLLERAINNSDLDLPDGFRQELYGLYLDSALQLRDANGARVALTRLRRMGLEDTPQFRLSSARLDLIEDNPEEAISKIEALRAEEPSLELDLIPDLARAEAISGNVEQALQRLVSLAQVRGRGRDVPVMQEAAALVSAMGTDEEQRAFASDLLAASEDRPDLRVLGVELLIRNGEIEEAREAAVQLVASAPEYPSAHIALGTIEMKLGDNAKAQEAIRSALELRPEDPEAWLMLLGAVHGHDTYTHAAGAEGHGEVEDLLNQAIAANPDSAKLYTELGLLHLSDARLEPAIRAFDNALQRAPGYLPALSLGALARADLEVSLEEAAELAALAREIAPSDAIAQDIGGWVAFKAGNTERARELLDAALQLNPEDTTTQYHRAVLAEFEGDLDLARALYLGSLVAGDMYRHYQEEARAALKRVGPADELSIELHAIGPQAHGEKLGTITLSRLGQEGGVAFSANLTGLPEGLNAAHVHELPSCETRDGIVAGAAGPHYGHAHVHVVENSGAFTSKTSDDDPHANHAMMGQTEQAIDTPVPLPVGDLDPIQVGADGTSSTVIEASQLNLDEIRGRSLIIHQGPDLDGKSGPKIACAIIN